ncbi:MAG: reverse transcriptase domain-containing protein [Sedimenticola sp.]
MAATGIKKHAGGAQQEIDTHQVNQIQFEAGRLKYYEENWRNITTDPVVLDMVKHCHFDIDIDSLPSQTHVVNCIFNENEKKIVDKEVESLLQLKVIKQVEHEGSEFISPIFTVPRKDGEYRMILNLKELNKYIPYHHFKMDTFETALTMITKDCYMASIDLRHAYYSVPVAEEHQKLLKFSWRGILYAYVCLPNGICCAPRIFTKLLKPVYATLRKLGHKNTGYIDDSLLSANSQVDCVHNINDTVDLMNNLGFVIHQNKSVQIPTQTITFLGNIIDSVAMIVTLPTPKVDKLVQACLILYKKSHAAILEVASVIGIMVSSFSAVEYGPLFYRNIEIGKINALKMSKGNFDCQMIVTDLMRQDLLWWINNLHSQKRHICHGNPVLTITSDASQSGWGATCNGESIGGRWKPEESGHHINVLELKAAYIAIRAFCKDKHDIHVKVRTDNICTMTYINSMGGIRSLQCNSIAKSVWSWCIERDIWISASHVPGIENDADFSSRNFNENVEWMLDKEIVEHLFLIYDTPDLDMFASRQNNQLSRYVSWKPDAGAEAVDAFSLDWANTYFYAFPPFSLVSRLVQKLERDKADCILVIPIWPTQIWYPRVMELPIDIPRIIPMKTNTLVIQNTNKVHPLIQKLN